MKKILGYHIYMISTNSELKHNGKKYYYRRDACAGSVPYTSESAQMFLGIPDPESLQKAFKGHYEAPKLLEESVQVEVIEITETISLPHAQQTEVEARALEKFNRMPPAEAEALALYLAANR